MGRNGPRFPGPQRRSTRRLTGCGTPSTTTPDPPPSQEHQPDPLRGEQYDWRNARIRDGVATREVIDRVLPCLEHLGVSPFDVFDFDNSPEALQHNRELTDCLPTFDVAVTLKHSLHHDKHHWRVNDIFDVAALTVALPLLRCRLHRQGNAPSHRQNRHRTAPPNIRDRQSPRPASVNRQRLDTQRRSTVIAPRPLAGLRELRQPKQYQLRRPTPPPPDSTRICVGRSGTAA